MCLSVPTTPGTTAGKEERVKNECKYGHLYQVISPEKSHGQCLGSTAQKLLVQVTPRGCSHRTSHLGQNVGHQDPTQVWCTRPKRWGKRQACTHKSSATLCRNVKELVPCYSSFCITLPLFTGPYEVSSLLSFPLGYTRSAVLKRDQSGCGYPSPLCLSCSESPRWWCWKSGDVPPALVSPVTCWWPWPTHAPGTGLCEGGGNDISAEWSETRDRGCQANSVMSKWDFVKDNEDLGQNLLRFTMIPDQSQYSTQAYWSAFTGAGNTFSISAPLAQAWVGEMLSTTVQLSPSPLASNSTTINTGL